MLLRLYRKLISLRKRYPALRSRGPNSFYYYNQYDSQTGNVGNYRPATGVYFYKWESNDEIILVGLNFAGQELFLPHPFLNVGVWRDLLHDSVVTNINQNHCLKVTYQATRMYLLVRAIPLLNRQTLK